MVFGNFIIMGNKDEVNLTSVELTFQIEILYEDVVLEEWSSSLVGWEKRSRHPTDTYGFHLTSGKYLLLLGFVTPTQPTLVL